MIGGLLLLLLVLSARFRLLELPLERDEGEYAYGAQLLLHGGQLYEEIHSMKWPGLYAAYALLFLAGGEHISTIHAGLIVVNLLTALGLGLLTRQFLNSTAGIITAICYLILSVMPPAHGIIANAEHFALLPAVWGLWLLNRQCRSSESVSIAGSLLAGFLLGLAPVMKQHAHLFVLLGLILAAVSPWPATLQNLRQNLTRLLLVLNGILLAWSGMCLLIWLRGDWDQFVTWTVIYPRDYTRQVTLEQAPANFLITAIPIAQAIWPILLLALTGLGALILRRQRNELLWGIGFLLASLIALCPGFYFREHYFLMVFPVMAFLCGWGAVGLLSWRQSSLHILASAAILLALIFPLAHQRDPLFLLSTRNVCLRLFGINPFIESPEIGRFLAERMSPDDRMVIFGSEPQIGFYAQRRLATGDIYMYPLMEVHPLARPMQQEMIEKVTAADPKFALFVSAPTAWLMSPGSEQMLTDWMPGYLKNFHPIGIVKRRGLEDPEYRFAPTGEWLRNVPTAVPQDVQYVAIFQRKETL